MLPTVIASPEKLVPLRTVAQVLRRDVRSIKRWIADGLLPPPRKDAGRNVYTQGQVERFRQAAENSGLLHHQRRAAAFRANLRNQPQPLPTTKPWRDAEPEPKIRTWDEISGERKGKPVNLPTTCGTCWRSLLLHAVTDPHGRKLLLASCELHGEQARTAWA